MAAVNVPAQFQDAIESDEEIAATSPSGNDSGHVVAPPPPADGEGQWDELEWDEDEDTDIFFDEPSASAASAANHSAASVSTLPVQSSSKVAPAKEVLYVTGAGGQNDKRFEDSETQKGQDLDDYEEAYEYYDGEEDDEGDYPEPVEQWADATGGEKKRERLRIRVMNLSKERSNEDHVQVKRERERELKIA